MTLPRLILALTFALLVGQVYTTPARAVDAANPPNIVFILADDMGYGDIAALNPDGKIATPHLDALTASGMHFTDAHTSSSVCTPTRYGLLTGRYNWRSRLKNGVLMGYSPRLIEEGRLTVPALLKQHGYHTACVGKWHLGMDWQKQADAKGKLSGKTVDFTAPIANGPTSCGFDEFFGISASLDMPPYVYIRDDRATVVPTAAGKGFGRAGLAAEGLTPEAVLPDLTDEATRQIAKWVDSADAQPHFLYFPLPAPHTPIAPTEKWRGASNINKYADFVMQVDHTVGRVIKALADEGLSDSTLVIFSADNGCSPAAKIPELQAKGHATHMHFRGHKADIYEGGHRVAFLAKWPGQIKPGSRSEQLICLTDLLATCADLVGSELPDNAGEDSISILPTLLGKTAETRVREAAVHHSINGSFAIRKGKWKLCFCPGSGGWSQPRPGRDDTSDLPALQLFDMEADPSETKNLQAEHPEIVEQLTVLMQEIIAQGRSTPGAKQANNGKAIQLQRRRAARKAAK